MSRIPFWKNVWKNIMFLKAVHRQRKELLKLDDRMLNDIGLSRVDAEREARRPFWDVAVLKDTSLRERNSGKFFKTKINKRLSTCSGSSHAAEKEKVEWQCCKEGK